MRIHRSLWAAGVLLAAVGVGRAEVIPYAGLSLQYFTAPISGVYDITASGAQGGNSVNHTGGLGGTVEGKFFLSQNEMLTILVGGVGNKVLGHSGGGGGSGATYVVDPVGNPLLIGGGGGGAGNNGDGFAATGIASSGGGGGAAGATGDNGHNGGGGGGFTGDGGSGGNLDGEGGLSYADGGDSGVGGDGGEGADGGFGGGGGSGANGAGAGGGGGYTGGNGGSPGTLGDGGFGGSSFDADPLGVFSATSFGDGSVIIDFPQQGPPAVPTPAAAEAGALLLGAVGLNQYRRRCRA